MRHLLAAAAVAALALPTSLLADPRGMSMAVDGAATPISEHVKVYGGVVNAESCVYDVARKLLVVPSRGAEPQVLANDGFVALLHGDGSLHTSRWIAGGVGGVTLNHPFGSEIAGGYLYVADRDGGQDGQPTVSVVRRFRLDTGATAGAYRLPASPGLNDLAVAADGAIYATQTGSETIPQRIYKMTPSGDWSVLVDGPPLSRPNGVTLDRDGNLVVVNIGNAEVLTLSPAGRLIRTEHAALPGNDGIVIVDGVKYVSSVRQGGVSRIAPGQPPVLIAKGIPTPASMCFDPDRRQLVIPMNANNALAFLPLDR